MQKKYIVIRDYQGGEFGMYRDYTAKEWGEQAFTWADSDGWENPEECLLENFKNEKELIDYIQEMWDVEIVELNKNNNEVMEFLKDIIKSSVYEDSRAKMWAEKVLKEIGGNKNEKRKNIKNIRKYS